MTLEFQPNSFKKIHTNFTKWNTTIDGFENSSFINHQTQQVRPFPLFQYALEIAELSSSETGAFPRRDTCQGPET